MLQLLQLGDSVVLSLGHGEVGGSDVAERCVFANLGVTGVVELREFKFDVYGTWLLTPAECVELGHDTFFPKTIL